VAPRAIDRAAEASRERELREAGAALEAAEQAAMQKVVGSSPIIR
jgi:hypothetical protein